MKIQLYFNSRETLTITLYQNNTIERWFSHFSNLNQSNDFYTLTRNNYYHINHDSSLVRESQIQESWSIILNSIEHLKSIGINVPITLSDTFQFDQDVLNILHRIFTTNSLVFRNDRNNIETMKHLYNINENVHILEKCTNPKKHLTFIRKKHPIQYLNVYNPRQSDDQWFSFDSDDLKLNYKYLELTETHVVTLDQSILGKCFYQSFAEHDDPTQSDCTGRLGSFGGFNLDVQPYNRKNLYLSEKFTDWCSRHSLLLSTLPLEFPLGYITDSTIPLTDIYRHTNIKLTEVKFLN
jgi:hypothetical protein